MFYHRSCQTVLNPHSIIHKNTKYTYNDKTTKHIFKGQLGIQLFIVLQYNYLS